LEPTNRWLFRCVASLNALIWPRPYSRCRLWRSRSAQQWFVLTHVVVERVDVFPPPSPPPPSLSLQGAHGCSDVTASISRGDHAVVECINVCPLPPSSSAVTCPAELLLLFAASTLEMARLPRFTLDPGWCPFYLRRHIQQHSSAVGARCPRRHNHSYYNCCFLAQPFCPGACLIFEAHAPCRWRDCSFTICVTAARSL
jgi:hypothetical protein